MTDGPIGRRALALKNLIPSAFYDFLYAHMHSRSVVSVDSFRTV